MDPAFGGAPTGVAVWGIDGFRSSTFPTELPSQWQVMTVDLSLSSTARSTTILSSAMNSRWTAWTFARLLTRKRSYISTHATVPTWYIGFVACLLSLFGTMNGVAFFWREIRTESSPSTRQLTAGHFASPRRSRRCSQADMCHTTLSRQA